MMRFRGFPGGPKTRVRTGPFFFRFLRKKKDLHGTMRFRDKVS